METIRLDKFLSVACGISRNDAKRLIKSGAVFVDGVAALKTDDKVEIDKQVFINGQPFSYKKFVYLVMNKPSGVVSASTDKRVKTVIDLVPKEFSHYDLFPVGRLDKDTTGLLLITNDGDFAHKIISPKKNIDKRYFVLLDKPLNTNIVEEFKKGVTLADGTQCMSAELEIGKNPYEAFVTIREGKYHQVKRMFGVYDFGVVNLKRLSIGNLLLPSDIEIGGCRELLPHEFINLQSQL